MHVAITSVPLDNEQRMPLLTLADRGRKLLESHRARDRESRQAFCAGALRSRELTHDAHLYRAYLRSAERLHAQGRALIASSSSTS